MKHLKKLSEEILHENSWWTLKHDVFENKNGKEGDYFYGETPGFVMVIPVLDNGKIILELQYRYLADKQSIEFPGGGIKNKKTPTEVAKQELLQETGWVGDEFVKVGEFESANGFMKDRCHVYIAAAIQQQNQQLDESEDIEVIYRRPDEIDEMICRNDIWCGQTMAAWALARHYFFKENCKAETPLINNILEGFLK